jgi:hypothetical protein
MGAKGNTFITALLDLIFNNTAAANIGNAGGLQPSSVAGSLYVSLHTADPGAGGSQNTSEAAYTGYTRVAVARSSGGWTITGQSVSPAALIQFPPGTAGGETCPYACVGTAASGAGEVLYRCSLTPNIVTGNGITPVIPTSSTITES